VWRKIFSEVCEIPTSVSSESRTVRWRKLTVKSCGMQGRARGDSEEGRGGNLPLRQHRESAHLAKSCAAAAATDPPTPTGDEKGRENERRAESRCGASRLSRTRDREKGRRKRERERRVRGVERKGLDAEISVTYSSCEDFNIARRCGNRIRMRYTISTDTSINEVGCSKCGKANQSAFRLLRSA